MITPGGLFVDEITSKGAIGLFCEWGLLILAKTVTLTNTKFVQCINFIIPFHSERLLVTQ